MLPPVAQVERDFFAEDDSDLVHMGLGGHHQNLVALLQDRIGMGDHDLAVVHDAGDDEIICMAPHHIFQRLAENGGILHLAVHAARHRGGHLVLGVQLALFILEVDLEQRFEQDQDEDDAQYAERVGDGIRRSQRGCVQGGHFRCGALRLQDIGHRLLGGAETGGIGDGARHDADHRPEFLACDPVDGERRQDAQQDEAGGQEVELDTAGAEGVEETGSDLQSDRKDEQDQAEVFHEGKHGRVHQKPEMAGQDAQEEDPGGADRDALYLEAAEPQAGRDHQGEQKDAMCDAGA